MACDLNSYELIGFCLEKKINLSLIVTLATFFLGYLITKIFEASAKRNVRNKYLLALLQEITLNVASTRIALSEMPSAKRLSDFLAEGLSKTPPVYNRPVMSFSYLDTVFKARIDVVQDLNHILIKNLVSFYGKLDALAQDVATVEGKGYETISVEGRESIFADLRRGLEDCAAKGTAASDGIRLFLKMPTVIS